MSLKIIYGKAGSGKSTYLFKYIGSIINNPQKIYIVTPEQFSFTAERRLLECTKGETDDHKLTSLYDNLSVRHAKFIEAAAGDLKFRLVRIQPKLAEEKNVGYKK